MEALIKNNGNTVTGKLAKVFIKIGIATELNEDEILERRKATPKKAPKKKVKKVKS